MGFVRNKERVQHQNADAKINYDKVIIADKHGNVISQGSDVEKRKKELKEAKDKAENAIGKLTVDKLGLPKDVTWNVDLQNDVLKKVKEGEIKTVDALNKFDVVTKTKASEVVTKINDKVTSCAGDTDCLNDLAGKNTLEELKDFDTSKYKKLTKLNQDTLKKVVDLVFHIHMMKQIYGAVSTLDCGSYTATKKKGDPLFDIKELIQKESGLESVWGGNVHRWGKNSTVGKNTYAGKDIFNLHKNDVNKIVNRSNCNDMKGFFDDTLSSGICNTKIKQECLKVGIAKPLKEAAGSLLTTTNKVDAIKGFCSNAHSDSSLNSTEAYKELCDGTTIKGGVNLDDLWTWAEG